MAPISVEDRERIARTVVLLRLHHLGDRRFDYRVPTELADRVVVGSVVTVPFGKRRAKAIVLGFAAQADVPEEELRTISGVGPHIVPGELLELAEALSARYLCSLESCLRLVAPVGSTTRPSGEHAARKDWVVRSPHSQPSSSLTPKQTLLLAAVPPQGMPRAELLRVAGVGRGVLAALERKGVVALRERAHEDLWELAEKTLSVDTHTDEGPILWPEQETAVTELTAAMEGPGVAWRLLWGVTGSGKTEVYLRTIEHALDRGRGAILLVPEIALTLQTIHRVKARFGDRVGVFHSGLPTRQRVREYRRVASGDTVVVVGARSAVFAPVKDLGLVIIDESHDSSYKQEEEPRYVVKTVAEMRLQRRGGLLLEGSATPAVESMVAPSEERLRLLRRAAGSLPEVEVVDMRRQGAGLLLAPRSRSVLGEVLRAGEQAIVLLNRRGYAGYVHCGICGHVLMCVDCELSLTYHSRERRLLCHHCGRTYTQPAVCPSCGEGPLLRAAPGTERLDKELRTLVPGDQVFRLDSDAVGTGARIQAVLKAFAAARPGVLVGTQMVAKGHDFPGVTLVIVADADVGLYVPDFRAAERTFQLLTQVAGRAGRAERPGRVLVQTWNPSVPCIRMALERDEERFYREELAVRRRLGYPPYADLIRLVTSSPQADRAQAAGRHLVEGLSPYFTGGELRGPAALPRLRGRYRWQVVIAAQEGERARAIIGRAVDQLQEPYRRRGVTLVVDVDPMSFG
jgi:primosomal protein N' (replication factor Y) (superfamily II helicase)